MGSMVCEVTFQKALNLRVTPGTATRICGEWKCNQSENAETSGSMRTEPAKRANAKARTMLRIKTVVADIGVPNVTPIEAMDIKMALFIFLLSRESWHNVSGHCASGDCQIVG